MSDKKPDMEQLYKAYMEHMKKILSEQPLPDVAEEGEMEEIMLSSEDGVKLKSSGA